MKVKLSAGATVDMLSPDEYAKGVDKLKNCIDDSVKRDYFHEVVAIPVTTTAQTYALYNCPLGSIVQLHRFAIRASGFSASNPMTGGDIEFLLNNDMVQFLPINGIVAPVVITDTSAGIVLKGGDVLNAQCMNVSSPVTIFLQFRRWNS
ncbi:MAG: hypothetical protein JSR64_17095 [Nitrospira sp.]|nr:hypothetical protein [Nitrospira sp.]